MRFLAILLLLLAATACAPVQDVATEAATLSPLSADVTTASTEDTPTPAAVEAVTETAALPTAGCNDAFAEAAAVSDLEDTLEDLEPAVTACTSAEDWTAASDAYPAAVDGADPLVFLANECAYGDQERPLCQEVLAMCDELAARGAAGCLTVDQ
jgi:hypothetical protein